MNCMDQLSTLAGRMLVFTRTPCLASVSYWIAWTFPGLNTFAAAQQPPATGIPTTSYRHAVPIEAEGKAIEIGSHAVTRCYDWDQDGDLDLLVGGGDGHLWLFQNAGTSRQPRFKAKKPIVAGGRDQWGA